MKNKITHALILFLAGILLISAKCNNDSKTNLKVPMESFETKPYDALWAKVDSLEKIGLYASAIEICKNIFTKANGENNTNQMVKAIVTRLKFSSYINEDDLKIAIVELDSLTKTSQFPMNAILHSITAQTYWQYYQQNRWKIQERTTVKDFDNKDIDTWSFDVFQTNSKKHFEWSLLEVEKLQMTPVDNYTPLLLGDSSSRYLRPTLYDLLVNKAIDFFIDNEAQINQPTNAFEVNDLNYFSNNNSFTAVSINSPDTISFSKLALKYLQDATAFHLKNNKIEPLIDITLKRLIFVRSLSTLDNTNELYLKSLEDLKLLYNSNQESTLIDFQIASYWQEKGAKYEPENGEDNRWNLKKAKEICEGSILKFPNSFGASKCKTLISQLDSKSFNVKVESFNLPDQPFRTLLSYKNTKEIHFCLVSMPIDEWRLISDNLYNNNGIFEKLARGTRLSKWTQKLNDDGDLQNHSLEIEVPALPFGHYLLLASSSNQFATVNEATAFAEFTITEMSFQNRTGVSGNQQFMVFERESGQPIKDVKAKLSYYEYGYRNNDGKQRVVKTENYITDQNGIIEVTTPTGKGNRNFYIEFSRGKDVISSERNYYSYERNEQVFSETRTNFFLDRAIYRPGQIVYFKGLVIQQSGKNVKIRTGEKKTVILYDPNSQEITKQTFTTNEFGSFNGSFNIPTNCLNGSMYLSCENGAAYFQVEEYKRPKFKSVFEKVTGTYKLEEEVKVKGTAETFAGSPVDGATVSYRIVRNVSYPFWKWWLPYPNFGAEKEIASGKTTTDAFGKFDIKFKALADKTIEKNTDPTFNFIVYADVTDLNGETHPSETSVSVGYKAFKLSTSIGNEWDKNKTKSIAISALNFNDKKINANGSIEIYKLKEPERIYRKRLWENPDQFVLIKNEFQSKFPNDPYDREDQFDKWEKGNVITALNFDTERDDIIDIGAAKKWTVGKYYLKAKAKDASGNEAMYETYFTVFDENSKAPAAKVSFEIKDLKTEGEPGEKAQFLLSSAETNQKIYAEVEHENKIVFSSWITLNNEQKKVEFPIGEKHRGNFTIHFSSVRHGRSYTQTKTVMVPFTNKELDVKFSTFRSKLVPGQNEEWKITVKGKKGDKIAAEVLASMYDASLDQFAANQWYLNLYNSNNSILYWQPSSSFDVAMSQLFERDWNKYPQEINREYEYLNNFGFYEQYNGYGNGYDVRGGRGVVMKMKSARLEQSNDFSADAEMGAPVATSASITKEEKSDKKNLNSVDANKKTESSNPVKARTNFSETAFFYPNLQTDTDGNTVISFTAPEALTKWKFMAMAHTKDLSIGMLNETAITQKDLMVFPNAPRFLREGDQLFLSTKISSLSDKKLNGTAKLELLDATTMKPIDALFKNTNSEKPFSTLEKQSTAVEWEIYIPESMQAVVYRVTARAGNFSDGEEMILPVLSNRMLVTETMPLPIKGKSTKSFTFEKLKNSGSSTTLKNHQLTLEFTANPAWYAVQALPYMMENPYDCSEQIFSRFYANSLASNLINTKPLIKKVFDAWKVSSPEAFLSNLEKNQELKSTILQETPWLLDAKNESESKKRIALFFDLNKMNSELQIALQKLEENQYPNGSFPWFKGMYENRYITQYIVEGLGHLDHLDVKKVREDGRVWNMTNNAIAYCDAQLIKDVKEIKRYSKNYKEENHLGYHHIHYLYARSFFKDVAMNDEVEEAINYFTEQGVKYWLNQNIYMQAMLSLTLNRSNHATTATAILKSLKERSIVKEEMGMYWKDFNGGYYWQEAPIEQQAMMIEAFDEVGKDASAVNELKVWLLKQKQTQNWKTTKATAEACYVLLLKGHDWLEETANPDITIGNQKLVFGKGADTKTEKYVQSEAVTGYFKTHWNADQVESNMANVTVNSKSQSIAYGGLYWQYFENLDKIAPANTPLKMVKKLYKEVTTNSGLQLIAIESNTSLKPGDKIKVRIELIVDRNMEYIHLKDMRASGFEPVSTISQTKYQNGVSYYESMKDASANFFFDYLPRGTYVFEYPLYVNAKGNFSNGITTAQCMYAPEFSAHSEGVRVSVK